MTIKDLAEKTGYSVATISRVLNNQPNVSEKAREEIRKLVEECGYQINVNAKQLKQHANSILVVVKGTANEMFGEMVETIQTLVSKTSYPLHVDYMDEDCNEVLRAIQLCREKKPLGILFLGGNSQNFLKDFGKIEIPCVLVSNDASGLPFDNLSSVSTDDRQAARCAIDSLIAMGHKNFVIVGGDREVSDTSRLRYEGCLLSFRNHGIEYDEELDYQGVRFSYQDGYNATQQLIAGGRKFTALFAIADVMAIGAVRALHNNGLRVPRDVSVMGFDGLMLGSYLIPQLSTVIQSAKQMAQRGVEILISQIEQGGHACHEAVPYTLHHRESTRRIDDD
ncbi:MAG: LacI family DNA-binding transcriptional regulator [Oscillospiraceae bacterium]|nr:LacI family DNA-binding transcriptional regulator [Oscillospiraceae bacterium]